MTTQYIATVGLNAPPDDRRIEPGENIPAKVIESAPWLIERGLAVSAAEWLQHALQGAPETAGPDIPATAPAPLETPASEAENWPEPQAIWTEAQERLAPPEET